MTKLKDLDYGIFSELLKNSKSSDREIAKKIGVSQPTVTRRRMRLEKEVIDSYTLIPKWEAAAYTLLVITLFKHRLKSRTKEEYLATRKLVLDWMMKHPNIIMDGRCTGNGADAFMISIHKNFAGYDKLSIEVTRDLGDNIRNIQPILVNLAKGNLIKPLSLKYLAEAR